MIAPRTENLFEAIQRVGHDEDFAPVATESFKGTGHAPGTLEKIEVLRQRVQDGQPLWHPDDRMDYRGLKGAVQPREGGRWWKPTYTFQSCILGRMSDAHVAEVRKIIYWMDLNDISARRLSKAAGVSGDRIYDVLRLKVRTTDDYIRRLRDGIARIEAASGKA